MINPRRTDHIFQRAHALAESGTHGSPAIIIATLVAEGYPEATDLLNSDNIRADLSRTCEAAANGRPVARFATDTAAEGLRDWNGGR